jgi:hypothetical protein
MSNVQPTDITTTQTIVRFSLDIIELILNTSATFRVLSFDANDKIVKTQFVSLIGTDYTNWGNDDEYVINFVAEQLGFIITS